MPNRIASKAISPQEVEAIQSLRSYVPKLDAVDDAYILRWLRSRDGRVEETADGLKKNMVFRKAWQLDEALSGWTPPEVGYLFIFLCVQNQ
jgi:hypothetical protein